MILKFFWILILQFHLVSPITAQNPDPQWVMNFKYPVVIETISESGAFFAAATEANGGNDNAVLLYLVSSEREIVFKTTLKYEGDMITIDRIWLSSDMDKLALTGYIRLPENPSFELSFTKLFDVSGKELWQTNAKAYGFLSGGKSILLKRGAADEKVSPCFRDEANDIDYGCLRIVESSTGELIELISFPGRLGGFGFVEIWDDNHIAIGTVEGDIYYKDIKDNTLWEISSDGLIAKAVLDIKHNALIIERGGNDAVYDKKGNKIWGGLLRGPGKNLESMPNFDTVTPFGEAILKGAPLLFWKTEWQYQGIYHAGKDEINGIFHWETFGEKFMRYSRAHYSVGRKRGIATTLDAKYIDYFNFEIKKDPATANEPQ